MEGVNSLAEICIIYTFNAVNLFPWFFANRRAMSNPERQES